MGTQYQLYEEEDWEEFDLDEDDDDAIDEKTDL